MDSGRYKWIALSNTTLGVLLATLDASITLIAMPDIFRGIKLDPLVPANSFYLLWMILGYLVVSSVLIVSLGRLGDMYGRVRDLQPRLRHLHGRVAPAHDRLDDRARRGDLPDRVPHRPGPRRRLPARERGGDHHRRVPRQPARDGARHQQHRRRERHVRRPRAGRPAGPDRLAARVPRSRCRSASSAPCGRTSSSRSEARPGGRGSTGGATSPSRSASCW